jgi:hypothetical protein
MFARNSPLSLIRLGYLIELGLEANYQLISIMPRHSSRAPAPLEFQHGYSVAQQR